MEWHAAGIVPSRHRPFVTETPTCPPRSGGTVPLHRQLQQERLIFLNVSERTTSTEKPSENVAELIAREAVGDVLQKNERYPQLGFLPLKRHVMQTNRAELSWHLKVTTPLFSHSFLPLAPADLVAVFPVSHYVCYWRGLRAAVFSRAACEQMLSSQPRLCRSCIPIRWPSLNLHTAYTLHTQKHKHTSPHRAWLKGLSVSSGLGGEPACVCIFHVSCLFSLSWGKQSGDDVRLRLDVSWFYC